MQKAESELDDTDSAFILICDHSCEGDPTIWRKSYDAFSLFEFFYLVGVGRQALPGLDAEHFGAVGMPQKKVFETVEGYFNDFFVCFFILECRFS